MRTAKQILNIVIEHLRLQRQKSCTVPVMEEDGEKYWCLYQSSSGCKDPVACLLLPGEYNPKMEYKDLRELIDSRLLTAERKQEFETHYALILALQTIHDQKPIDHWENQWAALALEHKLKYRKK
jgi:hypothetical protein